MRIRVIWEGKTKDLRLRALQADYEERIGHFGELKIEEVPAARRAPHPAGNELSRSESRWLAKLERSFRVMLDPRGREYTSEEFARWLEHHAVSGTQELAFWVGSADGFSEACRKEANLLLALSRMTLTHDWARTLLLEQIYRAFAILRRYPYAK